MFIIIHDLLHTLWAACPENVPVLQGTVYYLIHFILTHYEWLMGQCMTLHAATLKHVIYGFLLVLFRALWTVSS